MRVSPDVLRQLPPIEDIVERLENSADAYVTSAFGPPDGLETEELAGGPRGFLPTDDEILLNRDPADERRALVDAGARGLRRLQDEGDDADLDPDEAIALEAIVHIEGRPAIFIQGGRFFPPPPAWQNLEGCRREIETTIESVGRVEVSGHYRFDWVGTGFLVAPNVIMTNRHVAEEFCHTLNGRKWRFKRGMGGSIDYVEELGASTSAEYAFVDVIGVHRDFDLALFQVEQTTDASTSDGSATAPPPLPVAGQAPDSLVGRQVYAIGYPAWDGRRNDPQYMMQIFANVFNVKRLQPGEITQIWDADNLFIHDCSTLGGNSGSCVVDLATHHVIGLHFGGRYLKGNYAIALWRLIDDPLLTKAGVHFV